jgi:ergothioneine biosynthesis glutamate--cysteine ligase EgtA
MIHLGVETSIAGPPLSEEDAEAHVHGICFKTGPPGTVGVELEWLVCDETDPSLPVAHERVTQSLARLDGTGALPGNGSLTGEPGGQVELSSAPAAAIGDCIAAARADLEAIRGALRPAGLRMVGQGLDPLRPPSRVLRQPRYAAMEEFFDRDGPWGRVMMCSSASVQVCLDAGLEQGGTAGYRFRWRLLHALGPILVAVFANSPLRCGQPTGWKCARQDVWTRLDPGRTRAPAGAEPRAAGTGGAHGEDSDPRFEFARYALDAEVMCVRRRDAGRWSVPAGLTFRNWLRGAGERRPTADDLAYHLTTLFPPVRPHGHLELRVIDAQPADGWIVPAAVVSALVDDPVAADAAMAAAEPVWDTPASGGEVASERGAGAGVTPWLRAARLGPADPGLARAGLACFEAADAALSRSGAPPAVREQVADFAERYLRRGRCPADDMLEESR